MSADCSLFFQQGDDPPFLTVGTDVSAKYKGAFCEAKIKKVVRNIKCKVCINLNHCYVLKVPYNFCKLTAMYCMLFMIYIDNPLSSKT